MRRCLLLVLCESAQRTLAVAVHLCTASTEIPSILLFWLSCIIRKKGYPNFNLNFLNQIFS